MRSLIVPICAASAIIALSGCGADSSTAASGPEDGTLKIGMAVPASNQTYWTAYINSVNEEAEKLGVEVVFADAKDDAATQVEQVGSFLTAQVDGIVLAPVDPVGSNAAVEAVASSDIPLITSNRVLDTTYGGVDGAKPLVHTGFDDVQIGSISGEILAEACADKEPCNVVNLTANLGTSVQTQRSAGQNSVIEGQANIAVLDSQPDNFDATKAAEITASWMQKFSDIDVLTCQYDEMCIAAADVLKENGRDDIQVIGIGGSKNGIAAVEDGTMLGTAWVSPVSDGKTALETIVKVLKDEAITTEDINGIPTVPVAAAAVNKDNVSDYPGEW